MKKNIELLSDETIDDLQLDGIYLIQKKQALDLE